MLSADPEDQRRDCVVVGLLQAVMAQIRWGRAGLVRLPVIPSPSWMGMERCGNNTRGQSSGRPRRWFGGQTSERPRPGPIKVEYHGVSDLVAGVEPVGRLIGVSVDRGLDLYIG